MNTERLIKIVLMELATDALRLEQDLEVAINSDLSTDVKIIKIKDVLGKIVTNEASSAKFSNLLNNNEKTKPKEDE